MNEFYTYFVKSFEIYFATFSAKVIETYYFFEEVFVR